MAGDELVEFAKDVIRQSWDGSLDEPYVQELGVKLGLLKKVAFDPAIHEDVNAYDVEAGDPWYVFDGPLLARLSRSTSTDAVAGWKLVPVEPTPEMLAQFHGLNRMRDTEQRVAHIYTAMIAAAPACPSPQGGAEPDADGWKRAFAAQSRKLERVLHIPGVKEALDELTWPDGTATHSLGETGGTETGETLTSLRAERDALINDLPGTFKWELLKERNEAWSSLAAEKLKVEGLERERVELSGQLKMAEARAESCENYCVPISNDGKSVFIDGPGDFEIDYDGWHARAEALEQRVAALVGALKPFAALVGRINAWGHDDDDTAEHRLTARDIRRAAALATEA